MKTNTQDFSLTEEATALHDACDDCYRYYWQGEFLANAGHYPEALELFHRALLLKPDHVESLVFQGTVLIHLGRYEEAIASLDKALGYCSTNVEAWIFKGAALNHLGHYKRSYACYRQASNLQQGRTTHSQSFLDQGLQSVWNSVWKFLKRGVLKAHY